MKITVPAVEFTAFVDCLNDVSLFIAKTTDSPAEAIDISALFGKEINDKAVYTLVDEHGNLTIELDSDFIVEYFKLVVDVVKPFGEVYKVTKKYFKFVEAKEKSFKERWGL